MARKYGISGGNTVAGGQPHLVNARDVATSIALSATFNLDIPIPAGKTFGTAFIVGASGATAQVFFTDALLDAIAVAPVTSYGANFSDTVNYGRWRNNTNPVLGGQSGSGTTWTFGGSGGAGAMIVLQDIYIFGSVLRLVFKNQWAGGAATLTLQKVQAILF